MHQRLGRSSAEALELRVQLGELSPERLRLAAYLGDPSAREALGAPLDYRWVPFSTCGHQTRDWIAGLAPWGKEPLIRAALVATRAWAGLLRTVCAEGCARAPLDSAEAALLAWLREPSVVHRRAAGRLAIAVARHDEACLPRDGRAIVVRSLEAVASSTAGVTTAILALRFADFEPDWASKRAAKRAGIGRGRLRRAIERELLPWALGRADPCAP
ncbi:MAG: hypothetical protein KDD82_19610 [Planctomycetes bacterium]|nr:hypothetical protein [Planctomycetota bacterium]